MPPVTQRRATQSAAAKGAQSGCEVSEEWQSSGHPWINQRVLRLFGNQNFSGVVTGWVPASSADPNAEDPALFHVVYDDGEWLSQHCTAAMYCVPSR